MYEIRFHGRGGQGTVVASILLAKAFFNAGYYVQTFPLFGVERRGAPVEAYLRLDKEKILVRSNIYTPDHVVVQDAKLLDRVDVTAGLIAVNNGLGSRTQPIINTAMIGAFARVMEMPHLDMITGAIENEIHVKTDQNVSAARQAYDAVTLFGMLENKCGNP
ncbi:MAG: 2-oxoacid:acceptor oxidoreductase family protein [Deltaproteobacteria bacterium]|nr:2-oxoacid:acceptor oxidoreductase family protein [Deltaproteobacteria bacterium]